MKFEIWALMGPKTLELQGQVSRKKVEMEGKVYHTVMFLPTKRGINFILESSANKIIQEIEKGKTEFTLDALEESEFNDLEAERILKDYSALTLPNQVAWSIKAFLGADKKIEDLCKLELFKDFSVKEIENILKWRKLEKFNPQWYKGLICPCSVRDKLISRRQFFNYLKKRHESSNSNLIIV